MSRHTVNCKWCNDRPGGCLYCIDDLADSSQEKEDLIEQALRSGECHLIAVRDTRELIVRQIAGIDGRGIVLKPRRGNHQGSGEARGDSRPTVLPCMEHLWAFDPNNFKRRHCTRPGCSARQVFVFLPADPNRTGEWVDATMNVAATDTVQKNSIITQRRKGARVKK